jgi:hypothetical protein
MISTFRRISAAFVFRVKILVLGKKVSINKGGRGVDKHFY